MNILVTGANGQLGNEMRIVSLHSHDRYFFTDINDSPLTSQDLEGASTETLHLDITDLDAVREFVGTHAIQAIVNCAAWTNVDGAEDPEKYPLVELLNATAPENLAKAMHEVGGLLIQISTDYVFGKEPYNTPCSEEQTGTPTGVYGATKLLGEQKIIATGCQHVVIRTAWLYSEFGKNFCKTMLHLTATKPQLKVVFDQCGTPTYARDLADAIVSVLGDYRNHVSSGTDASHHVHSGSAAVSRYPHSGIYHFSNEGVCSWYDFTKMIQQIAVDLETLEPSETFGTHSLCDVLPCHSNEFPSPVTRPSYSVLDKTRIKSVFGLQIPYWTDSLRRCICNLKK